MKRIVLIFTLYSIASCDSNRHPLPSKFINYKKTMELNCSNFRVEIDSITKFKLDFQKLSTKTIECPTDCEEQGWKLIRNKNKEDSRVIDIIKETADLIPTKSLDELIVTAKMDTTIYYSSCYRFMKENETEKFRYYDELFFIDIQHRKLYKFKLHRGFIIIPY